MRKILETLRAKWAEYLLEMIVIVASIVGAFMLDNWNETSKTRQREKVLLNAIHKEFLENKDQFKNVVSKHRIALNSCDKLIGEFPIDLNTVNLDSIAEYIGNIGWRYTFNPSQGSINSLINTSSFETITNDRLRVLVVSWSDIVSDFMEEEQTAKYLAINILEPYLNKHFPFDANLYNSKTDLNALVSMEFENLIYRRANNLNDILNNDHELAKIQNIMDEIITLTDLKNQN